MNTVHENMQQLADATEDMTPEEQTEFLTNYLIPVLAAGLTPADWTQALGHAGADWATDTNRPDL